MKKLVDDVSVLAVEGCLIQKLSGLLSPETIFDLADADLQRIAGESDESTAERVRATEKLEVLESGMAELKRLKKYSPSVPISRARESAPSSSEGFLPPDVTTEPAEPDDDSKLIDWLASHARN